MTIQALTKTFFCRKFEMYMYMCVYVYRSIRFQHTISIPFFIYPYSPTNPLTASNSWSSNSSLSKYIIIRQPTHISCCLLFLDQNMTDNMYFYPVIYRHLVQLEKVFSLILFSFIEPLWFIRVYIEGNMLEIVNMYVNRKRIVQRFKWAIGIMWEYRSQIVWPTQHISKKINFKCQAYRVQ